MIFYLGCMWPMYRFQYLGHFSIKVAYLHSFAPWLLYVVMVVQTQLLSVEEEIKHD